jgi:hypothetical protein
MVLLSVESLRKNWRVGRVRTVDRDVEDQEPKDCKIPLLLMASNRNQGKGNWGTADKEIHCNHWCFFSFKTTNGVNRACKSR